MSEQCNEVPADLASTQSDDTMSGDDDKYNLICNASRCENSCVACSIVPIYIQQIAEKCSDYFKCLKLIAYRYRYVVQKLHDHDIKMSFPLETGCVR